MSENYTQQYNELMYEADKAKGNIKLSLLDQAIKIADAQQDVELGYRAREELLEAACFSGQPMRLLVTFPWMLAQYDKNPEIDTYGYILWYYKWVANNLAGAAEVEWSKVENIWNDMERRYKEEGCSLRPLYKIKSFTYANMGRFELAKENITLWTNATRDYMSDCHACDLSEISHTQYLLGEYENGLKLVKPLLQGEYSCAEEPHRARAEALVPYLSQGNIEEALKTHRLGYKQVYDNPSFLKHCGDHIQFLTLTGNINLAATLFSRHYSWIDPIKDPLSTYDFLRSTKLFLEHCNPETLSQQSLNNMCKAVSRAKQGAEKVNSLQEILNTVMTIVTPIAQKYDTRNESTHYMDRLTFGEEYKEWAVSHPIEDDSYIKEL